MSEKKGFTIIQNEIINSGKISLKALGLFLFLKSKPKDWRFSILNIHNEVKEGRESITSAVQELEKANFIQRKKSKNEKGQFEFTFIFLDTEEPEKVKPTPKPKRKPVVKKLPPKIEEPTPEENLFPEPEPPKEEEPPTPPPTKSDDGKLYSKMVEIYFDWFVKLSGVKPKFGVAEGSAMKQIINYFKTIYKDNHSEGETEFEEVTKMLQYIFKYWHLIDPFLQKQTKVTQINSNIQNIINDIKNGKTRTKSNSKDKSANARFQRVQGAVSAATEMLSNKK